MEKILKYLNRYFPYTMEQFTEVVATGINGVTETYYAGQYVAIRNTVLNDGVYKIDTVGVGSLTFVETMLPEISLNMVVIGLAIPRDVIALATEIEAYTAKEGLSSESIDDYSVSYKDGSGWQTAFRSQLANWRIPYSDLTNFLSRYRWQDRT